MEVVAAVRDKSLMELARAARAGGLLEMARTVRATRAGGLLKIAKTARPEIPSGGWQERRQLDDGW